MDIMCTRCDEPWDTYYVLHEKPEEFDRKGCLIRSCPACRGKSEPRHNQIEQERMAFIVEAAVLFGNDVDGFVGFLEDAQLI
jgi:hypothetical protein